MKSKKKPQNKKKEEEIPTATLDMWDRFPQSDPRNKR